MKDYQNLFLTTAHREEEILLDHINDGLHLGQASKPIHERQRRRPD
jgi:hypothetical protein